MAQIAAEEFGMSVDDIEVIFSDTLITPFFSDGSTSSRVTHNLGVAVSQACRDAKAALFQRAAERLGVPPEGLETKDKEIYPKDNPEKKVRIGELFMARMGRVPQTFGGASEGGEIMGSATYFQNPARDDPETGQIDPEMARQGKRLVGFYPYVAKAVEVAVNTETGQVIVVRCCGAIDLGKAINPKLCEQQSEGGMCMGIGDALYEEIKMDKGKVLNPNLTDYLMPSAEQMPPIENMKTFLVESAPHRDGPFGAKGFAEAAMIGMEPAIANALYDAVGVRIKELPITPEKVLKVLQGKN
jgi:CO/xanthine dehydrogenase Mo-binding subunit